MKFGARMRDSSESGVERLASPSRPWTLWGRWNDSARVVFTVSGVVLALFAPLGSILLRVAFQGVGLQDLQEHRFFYLYELIGSVAAFGTFGFVLGTQIDRLRQRRDWYREKANHDDLTGFFSHTAFRREVARAAESSRQARESLAILFISVGALSGSENEHGSRSTKNVLLHVASSVRHVCRNECIIGRWGGLELGILLPRADIFESVQLAKDLRLHVLERPVMESGNRTYWQVAVGGVAGHPETGADALLSKAQEALGQAHRSVDGVLILGP